MFYFTGDTHGIIGRFYNIKLNHPNLRKGDYIFVCGDFGYLYLNDASEQAWLDDMSTEPYTICFVDGNHENFTAINSYPVEEWNGGKVHKIRHNIIHLMRGQVYHISGKKIFTMGGAYSPDRYRRRLFEPKFLVQNDTNLFYWEEEIPSKSEINEAIDNLSKVGFKVDYIVSHTAPSEMIRKMNLTNNGMNFSCIDSLDSELTGFLEWVMHQTETEYKDWFFGHWHIDKDYGKMHALLNRVIERE